MFKRKHIHLLEEGLHHAYSHGSASKDWTPYTTALYGSVFGAKGSSSKKMKHEYRTPVHTPNHRTTSRLEESLHRAHHVFRPRSHVHPRHHHGAHGHVDKDGVAVQQGGLVYHTASKTIGKHNVKNVGKKPLKVSPLFKAKVAAAEEVSKIKGKYTVFWTGGYLGNKIDNVVTCVSDFSIANSASLAGGTNCWPWLFAPDMFIDAASILFNAKVPLTSPLMMQPSTTGNTAPPTINANNPNSFVFNTIQFKIINSYVKYVMRNVSLRIIELRLMVLAPRRSGTCSYASPWNGTTNLPLADGTLSGTANDCMQEAQYALFAAMTNDDANGNVSVDGTPTQGQIPLGISPKAFQTFTNRFKIEEVIVVLEPGQSHELYVQGPKNFEFDGKKNTQGNLYQNIQKYTRQLLCFVKNDLACSSTARSGHWAGVSDAQAIVATREDTYDLEMPEQAGGILNFTGLVGAITTTVNNNLRKVRRVHHGSLVTTSGTIGDVSEIGAAAEPV